MFKNTKRVEDNGWRFDWVTDRGDEFRGLRFYPEKCWLSSWSRKPHRAAKENFHPYLINENDWPRIKQACIERWGGEQAIEPKVVKELIPVKVSEVMVAPGEWRGEEWCKKYGKCTVKEYGERNRLLIRER